MFVSAISDCPHFDSSKIIDYNELQFFSFNDLYSDSKEKNDNMQDLFLENEKKENKITQNKELNFESMFKKNIYSIEEDEKDEEVLFLCISCGQIIRTKEEMNIHCTEKKHYISINLVDISLWCQICINPIFSNSTTKIKGTPIKLNDKNLNFVKNHIQYLREKKYLTPFYKFYPPEKIFDIKYTRLINNFKENKFKNIIFMVGAGISTAAGIPDFRSKTGLFKQLQDKYNMSAPEEFFYKKTFLQKPELFYEFCKYFDLSSVKPTITHKFLSYMISKHNVKYLFTQNIDGLELKAKIPNEKIIFAHGTFTKGHCPQCHIEIDINKINEGIKNGNIVYCEQCNGPCKPNVVFYGENLSEEFYEKAQSCRECDLVMIFGTSLQVYPFAAIPKLLKMRAWKVTFNRDKVGNFKYNFLSSNSLFLQGITDNTVLKLVKDIGWMEDFKKYMRDNFGDIDNENIENNNQNDVMNGLFNVKENECGDGKM